LDFVNIGLCRDVQAPAWGRQVQGEKIVNQLLRWLRSLVSSRPYGRIWSCKVFVTGSFTWSAACLATSSAEVPPALSEVMCTAICGDSVIWYTCPWFSFLAVFSRLVTCAGPCTISGPYSPTIP